MEQGLGPRPHYSVSQISGGVSSSLLVVLGATTKEKRHLYRAKLVSQTPKACNIILGGDPSCDIYYLFVIGGNPNGPSESIAHPESLVIPRGEDDDVDLVSLNIR